MTASASDVIEGYLARLRAELSAAGAADTEEYVSEIRSLLVEGAGDDAETAAAEIARLGEPGKLAQSILAERGLDAASGMSSGVWWRLGIAAPLDIAIGLAVPLAVLVPLTFVLQCAEPKAAGTAIAIAMVVLSLAWPWFIWRAWRTGGTVLSPGMSLTGIAIVRAPGLWRPVKIAELEAMGLAPDRRLGLAVAVTAISVVLLVSTFAWLYQLVFVVAPSAR